MMLPIKKYPDKILRTKGKELSFPLSPAQKKLVKNMFDTVRGANGIGLAAPQVGESLQVIVVNLEHLGVPAFAVINPKIISASRKKTDMEEGCLSIPGVFGIVSRPEKIVFSGQDINGKTIKVECDGLLSKVIQHETDHVNGVLIIDKIKKYTEGKELAK